MVHDDCPLIWLITVKVSTAPTSALKVNSWRSDFLPGFTGKNPTIPALTFLCIEQTVGDMPSPYSLSTISRTFSVDSRSHVSFSSCSANRAVARLKAALLCRRKSFSWVLFCCDFFDDALDGGALGGRNCGVDDSGVT